MAAARKHNRRRSRARFSGLYKLLSAVLILAAVVVSCVVFFRVNHIEVSGNTRYTDEEIIAVSGVTLKSNLVTVGCQRAANNLLGQLPYIDQVSVRRKLPDTVAITVHETTAAGVLVGEGSWWLINAGGKLLEQTTSAATGGLCVIRGLTPVAPAVGTLLTVSGEESAKLSALTALLTAMEAEGLMDKADSITLTDDYMVEAEYDGRFSLRIPMGEDFSYRMRFFREALASGKVAEGRAYTVDMTIEGETRFIPK